MKKAFYWILILGLTAMLSACQSFLEDYNYSPIGSTSSSS